MQKAHEGVPRLCPAFVMGRDGTMYSALAPNDNSTQRHENQEKDGTRNASACHPFAAGVVGGLPAAGVGCRGEMGVGAVWG